MIKVVHTLVLQASRACRFRGIVRSRTALSETVISIPSSMSRQVIPRRLLYELAPQIPLRKCGGKPAFLTGSIQAIATPAFVVLSGEQLPGAKAELKQVAEGAPRQEPAQRQ